MREEIIIMSTLIVLSGFIALELGFTTAIAELLAGMLAQHFLHLDDSVIITVLADIGILILMYVAGLEIDLDQLQKRFKPSLLIGSFAFVFPFVSVFVLSHYVLGMDIDQTLITSIALSTTSIAIIYPILKQTGAMTENKMIILSAAMITELMTMSMLGVFFTPHPEFIILLVIGLFVFAKVFPLLGGQIFKHYRGNVAEFEFKIILLLILGVAVVSERAGFESAMIAFLMGMITSGIVVQHENLEMKLRGMVFGFFAPIFFFSVGLKINLLALIGNLPLLLVFLIVCFVSRYVGTYIAGRFVFPQNARYSAALLNTNMTIGIIVAVFGYESGILTFSIYSSIVGALIIASILSAYLCRARLQ